MAKEKKEKEKRIERKKEGAHKKEGTGNAEGKLRLFFEVNYLSLSGLTGGRLAAPTLSTVRPSARHNDDASKQRKSSM